MRARSTEPRRSDATKDFRKELSRLRIDLLERLCAHPVEEWMDSCDARRGWVGDGKG